MAGYDGRIAHTIGALLLHPGRLTREFIEGHRVRYISPVRLYLTASVLYFVIAVAAPNLSPVPSQVTAPGVKIGLGDNARGIEDLDVDALRRRLRMRRRSSSEPTSRRWPDKIRSLFAAACSKRCRACFLRCSRCLPG